MDCKYSQNAKNLYSTFVELDYLLYVCRTNRKTMQLSKTEEQLMQYIWKRKKAFLKELLQDFPEPKPATTTVATLLKRITDKGFIQYNLFGKSREYFPIIKKTDYFSNHVNGLIKNFFNDSASQFASFFTQETNLSQQELEDLKKIIDSQIKKQQS